jgi:hypothetical protein
MKKCRIAYDIWQTRGGGHGHDRADWFEAENQLGKVAEGSSARYRLIMIKRDIEEFGLLGR